MVFKYGSGLYISTRYTVRSHNKLPTHNHKTARGVLLLLYMRAPPIAMVNCAVSGCCCVVSLGFIGMVLLMFSGGHSIIIITRPSHINIIHMQLLKFLTR